MKHNTVKGKPYFIEKAHTQYPYLCNNLKTDVLIVGGGITGSILAYYLSKNNIDCVLVEKCRIAHSSTSITTAILQYELDDSLNTLLEHTSINNIKDSHRVSLKALDELDNIIDAIGNNCCYHKMDSLVYSPNITDRESMLKEFTLKHKENIPVSFIENTNNPFGFNLECGVLSHMGGAILDPFKFTHNLLNTSNTRGARIYENTQIEKITYLDNYVEAITNYDYKIQCNYVICATGYETKLFTDKKFGKKYVTYNIVTNSLKNVNKKLKTTIIRNDMAPYNYLRLTEDNRIIFGGEDVAYYENIDNQDLAEEKYKILYEKLIDMYPNLKKELVAEYKSCGAFITTKDNLGYIGQDENKERLLYCLGYGANGILFAILGGLFLPKLIKGEKDPDMDLFNPNRKSD